MAYIVKYLWEHDKRREVIELEFELLIKAQEMMHILENDPEVIKVRIIDKE